MRWNFRGFGLCLAVVAFLVAPPAYGLINPNFTVIHLVSQADQIDEVTFAGAKDRVAVATVKTVIKGSDTIKTITLNLAASSYAEHATDAAKTIDALGKETALFFSGKMQPVGPGPAAAGAAPPEAPVEKGLLHIGTRWIVFEKGKNGAWDMDKIDSAMLGTWNGDTPMLRAAIAYIQADASAVMPCEEGVIWGKSAMIAKVPGHVCACQGVLLSDAGETALLVGSDAGDHLFQWDEKVQKMQDITAARKLASKSLVLAWGGWKGNGRFAPVSWDGQAVTVYTQEPDGSFKSGPSLPRSAIAANVVSLAMLDIGAAGRPAVLVGTNTTPLLWSPYAANGETALAPVTAKAVPADDLGAAGRCLIADFDGDGLADILQLFAKRSLYYKGTSPGHFAAPVACEVALGSGPADAFVGDFHQEGLLDVFTAGDTVSLWHNRGAGHFVDALYASGELSYKGNVNACGGAMGDFNSDGLQDVVLFYAAEEPHLYFNRGFRSFGLANRIDFQSCDILPGADAGQQTGCWADLVGNGWPALVVVLKDGSLWHLPFENNGDKGRCVQVALAGQGAQVGPVNVTAWRGKRPFGAWTVTAGTPVMISQSDAGPVTLKWRLPGGPPQSKDIILENAPVKLVIP